MILFENYLFYRPTDILIITFYTSLMLSARFSILFSFYFRILYLYYLLFWGNNLLLFSYYFYWDINEFWVYWVFRYCVLVGALNAILGFLLITANELVEGEMSGLKVHYYNSLFSFYIFFFLVAYTLLCFFDFFFFFYLLFPASSPQSESSLYSSNSYSSDDNGDSWITYFFSSYFVLRIF